MRGYTLSQHRLIEPLIRRCPIFGDFAHCPDLGDTKPLLWAIISAKTLYGKEDQCGLRKLGIWLVSQFQLEGKRDKTARAIVDEDHAAQRVATNQRDNPLR